MITNEFPEVILVCNSENQMFAKANNQGIRIAKGKYVLLLNSDTLISKGNVEKLIGFIENNPGIGCVGPKVLNNDGSLQSIGQSFHTIRYALTSLLLVRFWPIPLKTKKRIIPDGVYVKVLIKKSRKVGWISGCCMLIRSSLFNEVGLLDENLYFYSEEVEWCYRLKKSGYECWVNPDSSIIHLWGKSTTNYTKKDIEKRKVEQRAYVIEKTVGNFAGICVETILTLELVLRTIISKKLQRQILIFNIKERLCVLTYLLTKKWKIR